MHTHKREYSVFGYLLSGGWHVPSAQQPTLAREGGFVIASEALYCMFTGKKKKKIQ